MTVVARTSLSKNSYSACTDEQGVWDPIGIGWFVICHLIAMGAFFCFSWVNLTSFLVMFFITECFGITLGFHRLMAHRSFKTYKWLERSLAVIGCLTIQRSPLEWVAHHRVHHAFSDQKQDPHNSRRGFWWSHILWVVKRDERLDEYETLQPFARDIARDPFMKKLFHKWVHVGLQVILGMMFVGIGGWSMVVWAVFLRLVVGYHITFFVNSVCHKFGYRSYDTNDNSRNCWWVALLTFGEGWHNNHHQQPQRATTGVRWWEVDMTMGIIRTLEFFGLAWDIKES